MKFTPLDGDYVALPSYDRRYDSSRGITTSQLISRATQEVRVASGGLARTVQIKPDRDDAQLAAESIPDIKVGEYGRIMSAKVDQIVGPDEMVVSDIWLVDAKAAAAEKKAKIDSVPEIPRPNVNRNRPRGIGRNSDYDRYQQDRQQRIEAQYRANVKAREDLIKRVEASYEAREELAKRQSGKQFGEPIVVKGYPTAGLKQGERWTGRGSERPQIAIVGVDQDEDARGRRSRSRYVAVPPTMFLRGLDESQFLDLLRQRGVSPAEFVNMILKFKQADPSNQRLEPEVFAELDKRRGAASK
jgi:hypothetical protein